jgi:hypothetical protein
MELKRSDVGSFCLGLSNFIYFKSFGLIIMLEVIAVLAFVMKLMFNKTGKSRFAHIGTGFPNRLFLFGCIWLIGQYFSDSINHSDPMDTKKLMAQIVVLLILAYWAQNWFQSGESRLTWFILGYCFSVVPNYFLTPSIYTLVEPWKFCFGPGFTLLVFFWYSKSRVSLTLQIATILPLVYFDILVGSRALALVTIISWASSLLSRQPSDNKSRLIISIVGLAVVAMLASNMYHNLALSGHLGTSQQSKAIQQFGSGPLILVARSELLFELSGIRRNILFGSGSNPNISTDIVNEVDRFNSRIGVASENTAAFLYAQSTGKIPQHSLLFSFWMFGGIPAALFWIYLFFILSKWTLQTRFQNSSYFYLSRFLYVGFVWNFLFSPLGAGQRVLLALTIATVFCDYSDSRTRKLSSAIS